MPLAIAMSAMNAMSRAPTVIAIRPPARAPRPSASMTLADSSSRTVRTSKSSAVGVATSRAARRRTPVHAGSGVSSGQMILAISRRRRGVHQGGGQQVRQGRAEQGVADQGRAGGRGEAAGHQREELGGAQGLEVRRDHQRRFALPEEDHRGGVHRLDLAHLQQPADGAADEEGEPLDHPQVEQQPDQRAEEDDHRQHLEGEDRAVLVAHVEQRTEDEGRALLRVADQ